MDKDSKKKKYQSELMLPKDLKGIRKIYYMSIRGRQAKILETKYVH